MLPGGARRRPSARRRRAVQSGHGRAAPRPRPRGPVTRRLLVLGLDGLDPALAERLDAEGRLPHLRRLAAEGARAVLEDGVERFTGLAWEQFASGLSPAQAQRWSANVFDGQRYTVEQPDTRLPPFTERLAARTLVFDAPYFDLPAAARATGLVAWGAHDPGVPPGERPAGLAEEVRARFGPYPATEYIYGHVWPSPERTRAAGAALSAAAARRTEVARWLLTERLPDWDLALVVASELHSATESLWHGVDPGHPLHAHASAPAARDGLRAVYEGVDALVGALRAAVPDAAVLAFTPHGMGRNHADVAAMLLLPELLHRHGTGRPAFVPDPAWGVDGTGSPDLAEVPHWSNAVNGRVQVRVHRGERRRQRADATGGAAPCGLDWMPAAHYRAAWPRLRAFAVPAYYDGRVRVNLRGREARGNVPHRRYARVLDEVETLLAEVRDPRTGRPPPLEVERRPGDPFDRHPSDADLVVRFHGEVFAFDHPRLGRIGPAPCRRTGGHTGGPGLLWYADGAAPRGLLGRFPALEVPGAVAALLGGAPRSEAGGARGARPSLAEALASLGRPGCHVGHAPVR